MTKKKFKALTDEHYKAIQWCIGNNIKVGVKPTTKGLKIEIDENGIKQISPKTYSQIEAQNKCWELYLYLYRKYWKL